MPDVLVSLRLQNTELLPHLALGVSDPASPSYGNFRDSSEIADLVRPRPADLAMVRAWLARAGLTLRDDSSADDTTITAGGALLLPTGTDILVRGDDEILCRLFSTTLQRVRHSATGTTALRAGGPLRVPAAVAAIHGLHELPTGPEPQQASHDQKCLAAEKM